MQEFREQVVQSPLNLHKVEQRGTDAAESAVRGAIVVWLPASICDVSSYSK